METFVAHLLPKGDIQDDGVVIPLAERWEEYTQSLMEYVTLVRPNMLIEHETDGYSHGEITGLHITPNGVYCELVPGKDVDMEKTRWVSPRIRWNHTDVHGRKWPAALLEVSWVSVPRFLPYQDEVTPKSQWNPPMDSKFSAIPKTVSYAETVPPTEVVEMTPELLAEIQKLIADAVAAAMAQAPAPVAEEVVMEESMVEEITEEIVEPALTPETLMSMDTVARAAALDALPLEEKAEMLMKLSEELLKEKEEIVMSGIRSKISNRNVPQAAREGLEKLAKIDGKAFESALSAFPAVVKRNTPSNPAADNGNMEAKFNRAEAYAMAHNICMADAYAKV